MVGTQVRLKVGAMFRIGVGVGVRARVGVGAIVRAEDWVRTISCRVGVGGGVKAGVRVLLGVSVGVRVWKRGRTQCTPSSYDILLLVIINNND